MLQLHPVNLKKELPDVMDS